MIRASRAQRTGWPRALSSLREQPELERKVTAYHYEHCLRQGEPVFTVDSLEKKSFGHSSVMVALVASSGYRLQALYSVRRSESGYRMRRLYPEADGLALRAAFDRARTDDFQSLAELGLSYDELGAMTGRSRAQLRKALRGA